MGLPLVGAVLLEVTHGLGQKGAKLVLIAHRGTDQQDRAFHCLVSATHRRTKVISGPLGFGGRRDRITDACHPCELAAHSVDSAVDHELIRRKRRVAIIPLVHFDRVLVAAIRHSRNGGSIVAHSLGYAARCCAMVGRR